MANQISSLIIRFRVMSALIRRDLGSRHGGDAAGNFWAFFEPLMITAVVLAVHWYNGPAGISGIVRQVSIVALLITGFVPHLLLRHGGLAGVQSLKSNVSLLYHRQIRYFDLIAARLICETGFILITFTLMYLAFYVIGYLALPCSLAFVYLGWFLHIWFVVAMCFLFAGLAQFWPLSAKFFLPIAYVMIPVYGAFFMMSWIPANVRNILLYFPPADATEVIRRGYFGLSQPTYYHLPYTFGCLLLLTFGSVVVLRLGGRRLTV